MTRTGLHILEEITNDHAALSASLKKWMPTAQSVSQAQDEEMRNRQQFDEVHSASDLNSVNGNQTDVPDSANPFFAELARAVEEREHHGSVAAVDGQQSSEGFSDSTPQRCATFVCSFRAQEPRVGVDG